MKNLSKFAGAAFALILPAVALAAPGKVTLKMDPSVTGGKSGREIIQFGRSVVVGPGETARTVVVIGGGVDVQGDVDDDVVAIGGNVLVSGRVAGDAVAIGGKLVLGENASVGGDAVAVGGALEQHPSAKVGGSRNSVSVPLPELAGLKHWLRSGPLMGRPIAPSSMWSWALRAALIALYLFIAAAFPAALDKCAATLSERPATALGVGALSIAMAGPLLLLLTISVIGLAAVPLVFCGAGIALFVGTAGVYRVVGAKLWGGRLASPEGRLAAVAGAAVLFTLLYMLPGAGFVAWGGVVLFAFGAAILTFVDQFRRESAPVAAGEPASAAAALPAPAPASAQPSHPADWASLPRASFMDRLGAFVIDVFAFGVIVGILPLIHVGLVAWAAYQIGLWTWKGTTLGGIVCGIKGVRLDGAPFDLRVAAVRHLASYLSMAAGLLGFVWAAWDREQQTWHDKIAGTIVVRVPKGESLL
ncbi:MAG: RDD family protein [Elusimicrobia bacterium]|nr:RDD family protein [Elusimicrobiota bacterium]